MVIVLGGSILSLVFFVLLAGRIIFHFFNTLAGKIDRQQTDNKASRGSAAGELVECDGSSTSAFLLNVRIVRDQVLVYFEAFVVNGHPEVAVIQFAGNKLN